MLIDAVCEFHGSLRRGPLVRWSCDTHLTEEATMTFEDYLLHLFYLIDAELEAVKSEGGLPPRLRRVACSPDCCNTSRSCTRASTGHSSGTSACHSGPV